MKCKNIGKFNLCNGCIGDSDADHCTGFEGEGSTLREQWTKESRLPYRVWLEHKVQAFFTIDQIKAAFWETFHRGGDVRFETEENTESVWVDFEVQLKQIVCK